MDMQSEWFIWNDKDYHDPEWSRRVDAAANIKCGKASVAADKEALCAYHSGNNPGAGQVTWQQRQACMQAVSTLKATDDCVDSMYASAEQCVKVCGLECWEKDGKEECVDMQGHIERAFFSVSIMKIFTIVVAIARLFMTVQELYVVIKASQCPASREDGAARDGNAEAMPSLGSVAGPLPDKVGQLDDAHKHV